MAQKGTWRPLGPLGCMERHLEGPGLHRKALKRPLGQAQKHMESPGPYTKALGSLWSAEKGTQRPFGQTQRHSEDPGSNRAFRTPWTTEKETGRTLA